MRTRLLLVLLVTISLAPLTAAKTQRPPAAQPGGSAQAGKDIYLRFGCYECHGYAGHGGAGARLVPMSMPTRSFTAYVRNPRQMPPYSAKLLTDAQLADVWAYIKSLPESPAAKDIPLLNQILSDR